MVDHNYFEKMFNGSLVNMYVAASQILPQHTRILNVQYPALMCPL